MSQCSDAAVSLRELVLYIDALLLDSGNMNRTRELVETCLVKDKEICGEVIEFLADPDGMYGDSRSIRYANIIDFPSDPDGYGNETCDDVIPTPEQVAAAMAALHDIHCPNVEKVVAIDSNLPLFDDEGVISRESLRDIRWLGILNQVKTLKKAFALHWFKLLFRRFEQILVPHAPREPAQAPNPANLAAAANTPNNVQLNPDESGQASEHGACGGSKNKRSTIRGEARAKLNAALTKHHKYGEAEDLNEEPIGNNVLARLAEVDKATASAFFKEQFGSYSQYKETCRHKDRLLQSLKVLNGECTPRMLQRKIFE